MTSVIFIVGVIYAIAQAFNGRGQKKLDNVTEAGRTIQLIKDRADALELRVDELETQGIEDQKKIAAITAEKSYIENLNKQYLEILQNRNPELEKFMKNTSLALEGLLKGIDSMLEQQKKILDKPTVAITNQSPSHAA